MNYNYLPTIEYLYSIQKQSKNKYIPLLSQNAISGNLQSFFKGLGLEFHQVREYNFGDEIKNIDWRVTARTGKSTYQRIFRRKRK